MAKLVARWPNEMHTAVTYVPWDFYYRMAKKYGITEVVTDEIDQKVTMRKEELQDLYDDYEMLPFKDNEDIRRNLMSILSCEHYDYVTLWSYKGGGLGYI